MKGGIGGLLILFVGRNSIVAGLDGTANNTTEAKTKEDISEENTFVAAVVNFVPFFGLKGPPESTVLANVAAFGTFARRAAATGAEVVVFPEGALRGEPEGGEVPLGYNLCAEGSNSNQIMAILSCIAYSAALYLVATIDEAVDSHHSCAAQIVFDPDGTLIARHWQHSCGDDEGGDQYFIMRRTGLRIGLLLSEDLLDGERTGHLIADGVYHYALSFKNLDPNSFGTSLEIQQWWSYSRNVVLMASGLSHSTEFDPQSGIYTGGNSGRCLTHLEDRGLIVAEVSGHSANPPVCLKVDWNSPLEGDDHPPHVDYGALERATLLPVTNVLSGKWTELCQNDFCCKFYVKTHASDQVKTGFKLLLFSGPAKDFGPSAFLNQCGLLACDDCQPIDIVRFSVVSNKPGLQPNILSKSVDLSRKFRFSGGSEPKLSANEDVRSLQLAVLRSVNYNNRTTDSSSTVEESDQATTEKSVTSSSANNGMAMATSTPTTEETEQPTSEKEVTPPPENETPSSTPSTEEPEQSPSEEDPTVSPEVTMDGFTPSTEELEQSPSEEHPSVSPEETTEGITPSSASSTGKREVNFMQRIQAMNAKMAENAKHMQENLAHKIEALQNRITANMKLNQ